MNVTDHAAERHAERMRGIKNARGNDMAISRREIERDLDTPRISATLRFMGARRAKIRVSTAWGRVTYVLRGQNVVTCYPA